MTGNEEYLVIETKHKNTPTKEELVELQNEILNLSDENARIREVRSDFVGAEPLSVTVIAVSFALNLAAGALVTWLSNLAQQRRLQKANRKALEAIALHHLKRVESIDCTTKGVNETSAFVEFEMECPDQRQHVVKITVQGIILD